MEDIKKGQHEFGLINRVAKTILRIWRSPSQAVFIFIWTSRMNVQGKNTKLNPKSILKIRPVFHLSDENKLPYATTKKVTNLLGIELYPV